jgi:hypothetical protein
VIRVLAALALVAAGTAGCAGARPSVADMKAEPALAPLAGEVVLLTGEAMPRRSRIGVAGRDGAVERVVALTEDPSAVADELQRRFGERYHFLRTDLGAGSPNTVELRGRSSTGTVVIATASTLRPIPLFSPLAAVGAAPADHPTSLVVTVISRQ